MSEEWDSYSRLVGGKPALIYLDLGLARFAPRKDQPHMRYLRVSMQRAEPSVLAGKDDIGALLALEDHLVDSLTHDKSATYVGHNTSDDNCDLYFYTSDSAIFDRRVETAMELHNSYRYELGGNIDPEWKTYFDFLYPPADDLQRILSRRVIDALEENGNAISRPRWVNHHAYLPDARAAQDLRTYLSEQGFMVEEPRTEGGSLAMNFHRVDRPDELNEVVVLLARRVHELGGEYDGWGCGVVR